MFYRETGVFKTSFAADMALMPLPSTRWAVAFLGALFLGIVPVFCDEYTLSVLNLILIAIVGAVGLNILVGYTDQVSIGHWAFMSVGAYTAAHLITKLDAPFWIAVPAGGLMAAAIGTLVGIPSLRIKGLYLAIATLAAQLIIEWTINHVPWVSGGTQSTIQVGPPSVFGDKLTRAWQMYLFLMMFVILAMVGAQNLIRSRLAVRSHRADTVGRHCVLPRRAGLCKPGERAGRRRRVQGRHQRTGQQLSGSLGDRGI
jgi:branched-chain amino acid transport system permease protein